MRARAAYISSLGTTTILIVAAVLMLALVSALVAFHGWPGTAVGSEVRSVPLAPREAAATHVRKSGQVSAVKRTSVRKAAAGRARATTAGLVKQQSGGGGAAVPNIVMVPADPGAPPMSRDPHATSEPPVAPAGPGTPGTPQGPVGPPGVEPLPPLPDLAGILPPAPGGQSQPGDDSLTGDELVAMLLPPPPSRR
jgi:hypothetical protein